MSLSRTIALLAVLAAVAGVPATALAAPGDLDQQFASAGVYTAPLQSEIPGEREQFGALDSQGRIVVAATHVDSLGVPHLDVLRLTSQGTLDTTFNPSGATPGIVEVDFSPYKSASARGVVTVGDSVVALAVVDPTGSTPQVGVVKLTSAGGYDASFAGNGPAVANVDTFPEALAQDDSGRLLVGGFRECGSGCSDVMVSRFTAAGALDTSFDAAGAQPGVLDVAPTYGGSGYALAPLTGGTLLVASSSDANDDAIVARVSAAGALDTTFNASGTKPGIVETTMGAGAGGTRTPSASPPAPLDLRHRAGDRLDGRPDPAERGPRGEAHAGRSARHVVRAVRLAARHRRVPARRQRLGARRRAPE